jgi:bifunctional DNA-binding transcriptional regulator/antitoxin component of YhaV-PrlF toxin-antitoxin module
MRTQTVVTRLTRKCQTTIPEAARKVLGIGPGDEIAFDVTEAKNGLVRIRKAHALDRQFAKAVSDTLATEWLSKDDERAYRDL